MQTLGVFDSGLGGFNVVANLRANSDIDIVFLADHKNLPYGTKSDDQLKAILVSNMQWFISKNISSILIACNTASNYIDFLREQFPELNIFSIIEITSKQFTDENLIIFGTDKTVEVKKYDEYLNRPNKYHALSSLAELVENNDLALLKEYLRKSLKKYKRDKNNKYLLACTHYSIVANLFKLYLNENIYDSIGPVVEYFKNYRGNRNLEVYTTGNIKVLDEQLTDIFKYNLEIKPAYDDFKIVVVSDNHGKLGVLYDIVETHKDASVFIHCGDVELNDDIINKFYVVSGNNDYYSSYAQNLVIKVLSETIYVTHGHEYIPFKRMNHLHEVGQKLNASIVCFGHEHIYKVKQYNDLLVVNPGSLNYNRDGSKPSYMTIQVKENKYVINRLEVE